MIPKVIHYCWFGGNPLPEIAIKCIESWRKFLPEYEIVEWNESNFDVNIVPYTKGAYEAKKYAFVSDYARYWILYKYGGVYFDTDVEIISSIDEVIASGAFMGCERSIDDLFELNNPSPTDLGVNPGLGIGAIPGMQFYKEMLAMYDTLSFISLDGNMNLKTIVEYTSEALMLHGLLLTNEVQNCCNINIFPKEYFCPKDVSTKELKITKNTMTIHHFDGSWLPQNIREMSYLKERMSFLPFHLGGLIATFIVTIKYDGMSRALIELKNWVIRKMK